MRDAHVVEVVEEELADEAEALVRAVRQEHHRRDRGVAIDEEAAEVEVTAAAAVAVPVAAAAAAAAPWQGRRN